MCKWVSVCLLLILTNQSLAASKAPLPDTQQSKVNAQSAAFELITLGDSGGIQDGNLSAFLLRALSDNHYIALDAGSIVNGIDQGLSEGAFSNLKLQLAPNLRPNGIILKHHIKGYMISHGHLDHVAGMLISSPEDSNKPIYGLASVNQTLLDTYFNWQAWANFTNRGKTPRLNKYELIDLVPRQKVAIKDTSLTVTAFSLSHPLESTAFIIEKDNDIFVYFGDTGPDLVEQQGKLEKIWVYLAAQLKTKRLRGLIIEVSFDNQRPDNLLFGHLTPKYLIQELTRFYQLLDSKHQLTQAKIIISHIKYGLAAGISPREKIAQQLKQENKLGLELILAEQGQRLEL